MEEITRKQMTRVKAQTLRCQQKVNTLSIQMQEGMLHLMELKTEAEREQLGSENGIACYTKRAVDMLTTAISSLNSANGYIASAIANINCATDRIEKCDETVDE